MTDEPRPHADDEAPLAMPDIKRQVERLLVPVDGSPGSERAMAFASLVADVTGCELVVVVAYDPPVTIRRRTGLLEVAHVRVEMEEEAKALAEEAVQLLVAGGYRARGIVVRGDAAEAIIEIEEREQPDLVVLGRRGTGRLKGLLVGSVSETVARHAQAPVLLV